PRPAVRTAAGALTVALAASLMSIGATTPARADDGPGPVVELGYVEIEPYYLYGDVSEVIGTVAMQYRGDGVTRFEYTHELPLLPLQDCFHGPFQGGVSMVTWNFLSGVPIVDFGGSKPYQLWRQVPSISLPPGFAWAETDIGLIRQPNDDWRYDVRPGVRYAQGDRQWVDVRLPASFALSDRLDSSVPRPMYLHGDFPTQYDLDFQPNNCSRSNINHGFVRTYG